MTSSIYKRLPVFVLLLCAASIPTLAQWTTSSSTVYLTTTTNNVAIGTTSMSAGTKVDILGNGSGGTPLTIKNNTSNVLAVYAANATAGTLASFQAYRARGTVAAPTAVSAGDRIGGFYGSAYINGGYQAATAMEMYVGASPGVGSYPGYIFFGTTPTGGTTRLERMRITEGGSVGIGTATPGASYKLDVNGIINATGLHVNGQPFTGGSSQWTTSGSNIYYNTTGNVGIGTTSPIQSLDVRGSILIDQPIIYTGTASSEMTRYVQLINSPSYSSASGLKAGGILVADSYSYAEPSKNDLIVKGSVGIGTATPSGSYKLDVNGAINATSLYVNGQPFTGASQWTTSGSNAYFGLTGNVGIGSVNPDAKLTVNGTVHAKEVKVDLTVPGPDYVFDKDYSLLSLEDVRAYIEKHHHLPDVPSAAEMEKNGVNVSEMNMILLRKVEELTLHLIQIKEENTFLGVRVKALEQSLNNDLRK